MTRRIFQNLAVPVALLVIWQLMSVFGLVRPEILPSPVAIIERLWLYLLPEQTFGEAGGLGAWLMSSELLSDPLVSLQRVVLGFAVGAGLALPLGLQITTDLMVKYGVGKLVNPPKETDWVKTDLLEGALK